MQLQRNFKRLKEKARDLYRRRDDVIMIAGSRLKEIRHDNFIDWLQKVSKISHKIQEIEAELNKNWLLNARGTTFLQLKLTSVFGTSQQKLDKQVMDLTDVISKLMVDAENAFAHMKNAEQRREQEIVHLEEIENEIIQALRTESRTISMSKIEESEMIQAPRTERRLNKMIKIMGKEFEKLIDCVMPMILESIKCTTIRTIGIWGTVGEWKTTILNALNDLVIPMERGQQYLMLGGLGLTEPPKDDEWEKAKEIRLMDNELTRLPASPKCPILSTLLLQRNYKLRMIPRLFFENMPSLRVLNLSRTNIKFFPESLFKLVGLQQLYLNDCEHLMVLPPEIGELKHLEVLDLEGTEIIELPIEIGKLTQLTCLKISFYGYINHGYKIKQSKTMIPRGIISAFSNLEELSINVNPEDDRWDRSIEAIIKEVGSLRKLHTLNFYFPDIELLEFFIRDSSLFRSSQLFHFRFIVGSHVKRIVTRFPHNFESEFEQSSRRLIYVNGEGIIPQEIREVLKHATALYLDRHMSVKRLSQFGIKNMTQLEICVMGECNETQTIIDREDVEEFFALGSLKYLYIYYMKNLRSIWDGPVVEGSLANLKFMTLSTCPQLTTIFSLSMLGNLSSLEELRIEDCPTVKAIISVENVIPSFPEEKLSRKKKSLCALSRGPSVEIGVEYEEKQQHFYMDTLLLPSLKRLSLHYLPEMVSIIDSFYYIGPKLECMSFYNCPNLMILPISKESHLNLKVIKGERDWWDALKWGGGQSDHFDRIFVTC